MDVPVRQSPLLLTETAVSPEQQLAAAVFSRALADATDPTVIGSHRQSAVKFLLEDDDLFEFWASVANVNGEAIRKHAWKVLVGDHPDLNAAISAA